MAKILEEHSNHIAYLLLNGDALALALYFKQHDINMDTDVDEAGHTIFTRSMRFPTTATKSAKALLEVGLNPNQQDSHGDTPLHVACRLGSVGAIEVLLDEGVDLNAMNKQKETPLKIAYKTGYGFHTLMKYDAFM